VQELGLKLRNPKRVDKHDLNEKLLRILERQAEILEHAMNDDNADESATLGKLATTLDKLIANGKATAPQPKGPRRSSKAMIEIRAMVTARLAELNGD
jgi:hypothetical protein